VNSQTAAQLASWIRDHSLDAIVSTDGDADRPLMVDEAGALVRGDIIGILTSRFLGADTVVTPVTSNSSIEDLGAFRKVIRTKVGSPFVIAGMKEAEGVSVGFEANGGVLLGSDVTLGGTTLQRLPTRDAMLPILSVLGASVAAQKTVSQLVATLPSRVARSDRLEEVHADQLAMFIKTLQNDAPKFFSQQGGVHEVSTIDGLRFVLASGDIVHYRPSGNAPELRCYVEASDAERADELLAWGLSTASAVVK
jgi:phosphomannomutase